MLRALGREHSRHEHVLAAWLLRGDELQVERLYGYGSIREYGERVLGLGGRGVEDRLRVARALRDLPRLRKRAADGDLVYTVVREVCRVATPETEAEWVAAAEGKTATEVRRMVAGRARGDRPTDAPQAALSTRRVTVELSAEAYALWTDARATAVSRTGGHVDDSAFVTEAMLAYLGGGARDEGVSAYQIALTIDAHGGAVIEAGGESVPVDATTVAMARCDATELGRVDGGVDGRVDAGVDAEVAPRAKQTVPPRTRRQVLRRHGGRCAVPGCANASFVEVHHVVARSEGGTHRAANLVPLCSAHHRATHDGALLVEGSSAGQVVFKHADGRGYGAPLHDTTPTDAAPLRALREAHATLTAMGWREREARSMLDAIRTTVRPEDDVAAVVRRALRAVELSCVREEVERYQRCA